MKTRPGYRGLLLLLILFPGSALAALEFTLTPAVRSAAIGTELTFSGTLTNTSATDNLFLNDIHFDITGPASTALTPDTNGFFSNVPGILLPGETYTGPIFTVLLNGSAAPGDYSGSVTIMGGADIFAEDDLQTLGFQVASPLLSVSATGPDAYEFGPISGAITISRTGGTNYDLAIQYAITGTAANGIRYNSLSGMAVIPTGAANVGINIDPIPNDFADGDQTVVLTVSPSGGYNIGSPTNDTVTIHDKPIDSWRLQEFGNDANTPEIAGDTADPEGDGITNLMEYGLGSDPRVASVGDLPLPVIDANHLQLTFHRNTAATDITYIVEGRSDLSSGDWSPVMTRSPGGDWVADQDGAIATEIGSGDVVSVTITDAVPIVDPNTGEPTLQRFLRLRLQR